MQPTLYKKQPKIGRTQPVEIIKLLLKGAKSMNNNFSDNIKKIRKENHLSQEQLAEELGVSRQAISKWESGSAYPEMDKIISICKKYNVNIDDLLHKDIKELKGEEETKYSINKYVEEFFKFITDSINMFVRMKFKDKCKCIFEQVIIALILWGVCSVIFGLLSTILSHTPLQYVPVVYKNVGAFLGSVYGLVSFIVCIIIMIRVFKDRYLNYYQQEIVEKEKEETKTIENRDQKLDLKPESKIIVRDPKHSDYHFLKGLLKVFLFFVKLVVLEILVGLCMALVCVGIGIVFSFLVAKTGLFFIGCLLGCLSSGVALIVVIVFLFNFVFNRKTNKKLMIWSFVASILVVGLSIGMVAVGSIGFDFINKPKETKTDTFEIDMNENSFISNHHSVDYIIDDIDNIRVEIDSDKLLTSSYTVNANGSIYFYSYADEPMKLVREELKGLNEKKIYPFYSDFTNIKIYANSSNIEKLKNNSDNYYNDLKRYSDENQELREELENVKYELEEKTQELNSLKEEAKIEE